MSRPFYQLLRSVLFIVMSSVAISCSEDDPTVEVTIIRVTDLEPIGGSFCAYDFEPVDTTLAPKNYNQFLADCGKHQVGDRVSISRSFFK